MFIRFKSEYYIGHIIVLKSYAFNKALTFLLIYIKLLSYQQIILEGLKLYYCRILSSLSFNI